MNILQSVARQMLEVSLAMSLVIAVLLLLRPFLGKRYRAKTFYWVWLLVALRLAVPLNFSLFHASVNITVPDPILVYSQVSKPEETIPSNNDQSALPNVEATLPSNQTETQLTASGFLTMGRLASLIGITGAGIFLAGNLITYALFRRKVRRWSQAWMDGEVVALFRELRQEMGVTNITLAVCSAVPSPLVIGFIRPTLLLPKEDHASKELEAIFRHELVHAGRRDLWYKLLLLIARTIHWFNPIVHLMAHRAEQDLEISCDEAVVGNNSNSFRSQYGHAVLSATEHGLTVPVSLTTNFKGGKDTMKERLSAIAGKTGRHKGTVMICFVAFLVALVATACSVGGTTPAPTESNPASVPIDIQDVLNGDQPISYVSEGISDTKESTSNDIVSSTEKENEPMSELETLASVLQWDGISYIVTNGSTGEQVRLATSSDVDKMKSLLDGISILRQDDRQGVDIPTGYLYAIRAVDEYGNLSDAICVLNGHVQIGGRVGYYVENDELLINYLESLY